MSSTVKADWEKVKVVILDVDGTLYDQKQLRIKMLCALALYYICRPWRYKELMLLQRFRKEREQRAGTHCSNLEEVQYSWCVEQRGSSTIVLKKAVERWIFQFPLRYLKACRYPGVAAFLQALQQQGVKIGIYSDYKAVDKLKAMGLDADVVVSSTDKEVNSLKPHPNGLLYIAQVMGVKPAECIFIGDRHELDGVCAERADMPYLIIDKKPHHRFDFYHKQLSNFLSVKNKKSKLETV